MPNQAAEAGPSSRSIPAKSSPVQNAAAYSDGEQEVDEFEGSGSELEGEYDSESAGQE